MKIVKYLADRVKRVGMAHGKPRIWLEGNDPARVGFVGDTRYNIVVNESTLSLVINPDGSRKVTCRADRGIPVIDINSEKFLSIFDGMEAVRVIFAEGAIHILPLAAEKRRMERLSALKGRLESGQPLRTASLATGIGIMDNAVKAGLQDTGLSSELSFACEIREQLLDHAAKHNDAWSRETLNIAAPLQVAAFDEWLMNQLPQVDILESGIPCSGASKAGRSKLALSCPEQHPDVGHLIAGAIAIIAKVNPAIVLFENVPEYQHSASGAILRQQLRDLGYDTHETILEGSDFNCLENRKRWCFVAVTRGMSFDFAAISKPAPRIQTLGEVLEPIADDDPRWSEMQGLKDKEVRDKAAGKGFAMQVFTESSTSIGTITKGYAKVRSTDPKLAHPTNPKLLRQLTPVEHARVKGVPEHLIAGMSNTVAHEALGQGILYAPFRAVGRLIGEAIAAFAATTLDIAGGVELGRAAA